MSSRVARALERARGPAAVPRRRSSRRGSSASACASVAVSAGSGLSSASMSSSAARGPSVQLRSITRRSDTSSMPYSAARSTLVSTCERPLVRAGAAPARCSVGCGPVVRRPPRLPPRRARVALGLQDPAQRLAAAGVDLDELHAHAVRLLRLGGVVRLDPDDLALAGERDRARRQLNLEAEDLSLGARRAAGEEDSAASDVRREPLDEGVEIRIAQPNPNRCRSRHVGPAGSIAVTAGRRQSPGSSGDAKSEQPPGVLGGHAHRFFEGHARARPASVSSVLTTNAGSLRLPR